MYEYDEDELEVVNSDPSIEINDALKQINVSGEIQNYEVIQIFYDNDIEKLSEDDILNQDFYIGDDCIKLEGKVRCLYEDENDYNKETGRVFVITKMSCGDESIDGLDIEV